MHLMANSADPVQLASEEADLDLYCFQMQGISRFSRTRVNDWNTDGSFTVADSNLFSFPRKFFR